MKPSFSLKWLFVGIGFLALLLGWITDRQQLINAIRAREQREERAIWGLYEAMGRRSFSAVFPHSDHVELIEGEIDERFAHALLGSGYATLELHDVKVHPDADAVLKRGYDLTVDGNSRYYRWMLGP